MHEPCVVRLVVHDAKCLRSAKRFGRISPIVVVSGDQIRAQGVKIDNGGPSPAINQTFEVLSYPDGTISIAVFSVEGKVMRYLCHSELVVSQSEWTGEVQLVYTKSRGDYRNGGSLNISYEVLEGDTLARGIGKNGFYTPVFRDIPKNMLSCNEVQSECSSARSANDSAIPSLTDTIISLGD